MEEKIIYEVIKYKDDLGRSVLELNIEGPSINYIIINTIRRTILSDIPIYAFTNFNFTTNESIFNNNVMKLRLNNMPVWGIPNKIDKFVKENKSQTNNNVLEDENNDDFPLDDDIDLENETNVNISSLNQLTMYVDYKNTENAIVSVTTNHAKFYYGNKNIDCPYHIPLVIIKLQPYQSINFSAITVLGTEKENAIFSPVSVCYYNEISDNKFKFIIESKGQITEQRIIEVALINIISSLENLVKIIPLEQNSHKGKIIINGENNTMGNLLSYAMQIHKEVKFAGYNIPHLLENKVIIDYELINEKIKLKDVFNEINDYLINIFKILLKCNKKIDLKTNTIKKSHKNK